MSEGYGFGKVILFGEHFVVYGLPGIASGIDKHVKAAAEKNKDGILFCDRKFNCDVRFGEQKDHPLCKTFENVFKYFDVKNAKITITGDAFPKAGMGYSAALAVAVIRALAKFTEKKISDEEVNRLAYECEKVAHGSPSGIDNTCATYGKIIWFKKNMEGGKNSIEPIDLKGRLLLVMGNTGTKGDTKAILDEVRKRKGKEPGKYAKIFSQAEDLVKRAKERIIAYDLKSLGNLMNENHALLQQIGVSSANLDRLCEVARKNGALGAKLTGAGQGGFMIALAENEASQKRIAKAIENEGFDALLTKIGR